MSTSEFDLDILCWNLLANNRPATTNTSRRLRLYRHRPSRTLRHT